MRYDIFNRHPMKKALITGSETFGKYMSSPSKWLALSADGRIVSGHEVHSMVFPAIVLFDEADDPGERIIQKAKEIEASVIISFGMASDAKGFRLERTATNWIYNEKYCTPNENNRPLRPERTERESLVTDLSPWNVSGMTELFSTAGIPFDSRISDDPGQYSCNGWMYTTLLAKEKHSLDIPYLFVHMACTEDAIALIPDFDRSKVIIRNEETLKALEVLLQSYT